MIGTSAVISKESREKFKNGTVFYEEIFYQFILGGGYDDFRHQHSRPCLL